MLSPVGLTLCGVAVWALQVASTTFNISNFQGELESGTGVLKSLRPSRNESFDFMPSDVWVNITGNRVYHTGDLNLRWKDAAGVWTDGSTAWDRETRFQDLGGDSIQSWNVSASFPSLGLDINRTWTQQDGDLVLLFTLKNTQTTSITIGGLGIPLEVNNIFSNRRPIDTINICSLIEPYIGLQAGHARVTSLTGVGPNMIITPINGDTKLEAWDFLLQGTSTYVGYQSTSYEGNFAWQVYTRGYSNSYWKGAPQWHEPTELILEAQEEKVFGVRFTFVDAVENFDAAVNNVGLPTAVGLPSYVLSRDVVGRLYLKYSSDVAEMEVLPSGALSLNEINETSPTLQGYTVTAGSDFFGRALVNITYQNGLTQTVHYWVGDPSSQAIQKFGQFITDNQWYTNLEDTFRRAPCLITYQRTSNDLVLQEQRWFISGLVDEAGAGPWVGLATKQLIQPEPDQISILETFINSTVWGTLQHSQGNETYGVVRSLFYFDRNDPPTYPGYIYSREFAWPEGTSSKSFAAQVDRTFNYVWVSSLYWSMYKASRLRPGILQLQSPQWYLQQAYETVHYAFSTTPDGKNATSSTQQGLLGSSFWGDLIDDLRYEGMLESADFIVDTQRRIQAYWASLAAPYGSEQPWDNTAHESVYYWSIYNNDSETALKTVNSVRGFDFAIPHWGYNGNARRYWDFGTAGQYSLNRIERQIHHYGSPFCSIPLLDWFKRTPDPTTSSALYNLRVGYGGHSAALSNIGEDGFGSMAFHAWPDQLKWDNYTGDYGPSFLGHYLSASSFLAFFPDLGWQAFGGNLEQTADGLTVQHTDAAARRLFIADCNLDVRLEAGTIDHYVYQPGNRSLSVTFEVADLNQTIVWYNSPAGTGNLTLEGDWDRVRGGYVIPVPTNATVIRFS